MRRAAFTLIEISVVMLILTLILSGAGKLMIVASDRFVRQEEAMVLAAEAATLIARMRADFERAVIPVSVPADFGQAARAVVFKEDVLSFTVRDGESDKPVSYGFDPSDRSITRQYGGTALTLGRGMVGSFFAVYQVFSGETKQGVIHGFPFDPDSVGAAPPEPPPETQVWRAWVKVKLVLQGDPRARQPARQEYVFRIHPLRMNRQVQSLWATQSVGGKKP